MLPSDLHLAHNFLNYFYNKCILCTITKKNEHLVMDSKLNTIFKMKHISEGTFYYTKFYLKV